MKNYSRIDKEVIEDLTLSPDATKSKLSKGRIFHEKEDPYRTCFARDRDRIIHAKSFRRLKHKTQVFLAPDGDHYRTRLTHTLEVMQIALSIAGTLGLNRDLTEAIALGHDLGHTPFGHCGERVLNDIYPGGFVHNEQSLRVVDCLEIRENKAYRGLNLTYEVRDGILNHSGDRKAATPEGQLIYFADRIAYLNHDFDDARRAGLLKDNVLPKEIRLSLGESAGERIDRMIGNLVENSFVNQSLGFSDEVQEATLALRDFMFKNLYLNSHAKTEEGRAEKLMVLLYEYFLDNPNLLPKDYRYEDVHLGVKDYIAGMSDRYAIDCFRRIFLPKFWQEV
ncbi:MAG: deoxyguanosinetriphosphate triphosphohydrolase [Tissierellia bacterium]|jgi:dGTPase|nr:deoxyguanosinetriphosphate triphosphohydrolase [Tissierellia bacterium]